MNCDWALWVLQLVWGGDLISVVHQVLRVIPANAVLLPTLQRKLHCDDMIACLWGNQHAASYVFKCFNQCHPNLGHLNLRLRVAQQNISWTWVPASVSLVIPLLGLVSPPSPWLRIICWIILKYYFGIFKIMFNLYGEIDTGSRGPCSSGPSSISIPGTQRI